MATAALRNMLTAGIAGVIVVYIVYEFVDEFDFGDGLTDTIVGFVAPVVGAVVLLKVLGYL